jgi:iron-sulfur cluster repair protein YtfE (RIC family)
MGGKFNGRRIGRTDAFAMLDSSHRRLEERVADLLKAAGAIARGRGRATHLDTIAEVLDYFDRAAVRHEADEEESVFPRLDKRKSARLVTTLTKEHKMHRKLIKKLRTVFSNFTSEPTATEGAALLRMATELDAAYRGHIDLEEAELMPVMRDQLSAFR